VVILCFLLRIMKLAIFSALLAVAFASGPDPNEVYIESLTYGGSGCPRGTVGYSISNDRQIFTLIFDKYIASIGPGIPVTENRKNCQLNIRMHYPQGWQYAVLSSQFRGYAQLDAGITGTHKSTYYFSGEVDQVSATCDFRGPTARNYLVNAEIGTVAWSPCASTYALNINSQLRLYSSKPGASGMLTNDSQDGKWRNILGFQWRHC
jgi:hypothetical protein